MGTPIIRAWQSRLREGFKNSSRHLATSRSPHFLTPPPHYKKVISKHHDGYKCTIFDFKIGANLFYKKSSSPIDNIPEKTNVPPPTNKKIKIK